MVHDDAMGSDESSAGCVPTHVAFPPGRRNVLVPLAPAAATSVGLSLYAACRPGPLLAQAAVWLAVTTTRSGRVVPGPKVRYDDQLPEGVMPALVRAWAASAGAPPAAVGVYRRLQPERTGSTFAVCAGRSSRLVRVHRTATALDREKAVSAAAQRLTLSTFRVPRLLDEGVVQDDWHWASYELISRRPHRPVTALPAGLLAEVEQLVLAVVPAPPGTPTHWKPAHGDLNPWNLRRARGGAWLIDWEDAAWLPPHADRVYFDAVTTAIRLRRPRPPASRPEDEEARRYWAAVVLGRNPHGTENGLRDRLLELLDD